MQPTEGDAEALEVAYSRLFERMPTVFALWFPFALGFAGMGFQPSLFGSDTTSGTLLAASIRLRADCELDGRCAPCLCGSVLQQFQG